MTVDPNNLRLALSLGNEFGVDLNNLQTFTFTLGGFDRAPPFAMSEDWSEWGEQDRIPFPPQPRMVLSGEISHPPPLEPARDEAGKEEPPAAAAAAEGWSEAGKKKKGRRRKKQKARRMALSAHKASVRVVRCPRCSGPWYDPANEKKPEENYCGACYEGLREQVREYMREEGWCAGE